MKQYVLGIVLLSLVCLGVSFKEEDCEVCVATIREFSETLTDDVKADPKKIEDAFKDYCLTAKSKQQRLVRISIYDMHIAHVEQPFLVTRSFVHCIWL